MCCLRGAIACLGVDDPTDPTAIRAEIRWSPTLMRFPTRSDAVSSTDGPYLNTGEIREDQLNGLAPGMLMSEQLAQSIRVLRRRWRIMALVPLLALVVSLAVSVRSNKEYTATAKVVLNPQNPVNQALNPGSQVASPDPERDLNTQVSQITETPVANLVRGSLHLAEDSQTLLGQVSAGLEGTTNIVDIVVTDASPQRAALIANGFAAQYIGFHLANERSTFQQAETLVRNHLGALTPAERSTATGKLLESQITALQADSAVLTSDAQISQTATTPSSPSSPRPLFDAVVALVVGLLIAIVVVIVLELLDRSVRDEEDASAVTRLPSLGVIPKQRPRMFTHRASQWAHLGAPGGHDPPLAPDRAAGSIAAGDHSTQRSDEAPTLDWEQQESYGSLAITVLSLRLSAEENVVMITSSGPQDGKTSVTLGLAAALAAIGQRVIAVECDLRRPRFADYLGLPPAADGVSSILAGRIAATAGLVSIDAGTYRPRPPGRQADNGAGPNAPASGSGEDPQFSVVPAGPIPRRPQALLSGPELPLLLRELQSMADIVLVDTPPLGVIKDAVVLAEMVDQVVLVARVGHTRRDALKRCRIAVDQLNSRLLGVVTVGGSMGDLGYYAGGNAGAAVANLREPDLAARSESPPGTASEPQRATWTPDRPVAAMGKPRAGSTNRPVASTEPGRADPPNGQPVALTVQKDAASTYGEPAASAPLPSQAATPRQPVALTIEPPAAATEAPTAGPTKKPPAASPQPPPGATPKKQTAAATKKQAAAPTKQEPPAAEKGERSRHRGSTRKLG